MSYLNNDFDKDENVFVASLQQRKKSESPTGIKLMTS